MIRWYCGFAAHGNPEELIRRVSFIVSQQRLGDSVPVVRVEKPDKGKGRGRGGQFYFFLGIQSSQAGQAPDSVRQHLLDSGILGHRLRDLFTAEQIRHMCSGEVVVRDYVCRLPYWRPFALPDTDPFAGGPSPVPADEDGAATLRYDRLLLWLSALFILCDLASRITMRYPAQREATRPCAQRLAASSPPNRVVASSHRRQWNSLLTSFTQLLVYAGPRACD